MDHDQTVCPRCGGPAGEHRFCEPCRSHLDSLTGISTRAQAHAGEPAAAQAPREIRRSEQAWAGPANGEGDETTREAPPAAVQVGPGPPPAEDRTVGVNTEPLEKAKFSSSVDHRASDGARAPHEVARLEDVLTIAANEGTGRSAAADSGSVEQVELPAGDDSRESDWVRLRRQVARLEQAISLASADANQMPAARAPAVEEVELGTCDQPSAGEPSPVSAHVLREAFWFEQALAFKSDRDREATSVPPPQTAAPDVDQVQTQPCKADVQPGAEPTRARFLTRLWQLQPPRRWLAALGVLALIGLVAVLTARDLRPQERESQAQV